MKFYDEDEIFSPEARWIGRWLFLFVVVGAIVHIIIPGMWLIGKSIFAAP